MSRLVTRFLKAIWACKNFAFDAVTSYVCYEKNQGLG